MTSAETTTAAAKTDAARPLSYEVAALLVAANGALDAYTFLQHQVFANAQTGNVVLFAVGLVRPDIASPLTHLWPVLAFIAGVMIARVLHGPRAAGSPPRLRRWVFVVQVVVLGLIAAAPDAAPVGAVVTVISFLAGLQLALFRTVGARTFVPIAMTGNLMRATEAVHTAVTGTAKQWREAAAQLALIGIFTGGVVLGAVATTHLGGRAAVVPAGLFTLDLAWLVLRRRRRGEPAGS